MAIHFDESICGSLAIRTHRFSWLIWTLRCHLLRFSRTTVQFYRAVSLSICQLFLLCLAIDDNTLCCGTSLLFCLPLTRSSVCAYTFYMFIFGYIKYFIFRMTVFVYDFNSLSIHHVNTINRRCWQFFFLFGSVECVDCVYCCCSRRSIGKIKGPNLFFAVVLDRLTCRHSLNMIRRWNFLQNKMCDVSI